MRILCVEKENVWLDVNSVDNCLHIEAVAVENAQWTTIAVMITDDRDLKAMAKAIKKIRKARKQTVPTVADHSDDMTQYQYVPGVGVLK